MVFVDGLRVRGIACVLAVLLAFVAGAYGNNEIETSYDNGMKMLRDVGKGTNGNPIKNTKRSTVNSTSVGLWFGPRLGKRRKSAEKPEIEPEDVEAIAEALNAGPWAFISIPRSRRTDLQRRQATQFTPRLGRELPEESSEYDVPDKPFNQDQEMQTRLPLDALQQRYVTRDEQEQLSPLLRNLLRKALI